MEKLKLLLDNNTLDLMGNIIDSIFLPYKDYIELFICATVIEELASIPDVKRDIRVKNLLSLAKLETKFLNDSIIVWDNSRWDCVNWSNGCVYNEILNNSRSNIHDAIIAETAVKNDCYLVTNDIRLYKKMKKRKYKVLNFDELKGEIEKL